MPFCTILCTISTMDAKASASKIGVDAFEELFRRYEAGSTFWQGRWLKVKLKRKTKSFVHSSRQERTCWLFFWVVCGVILVGYMLTLITAANAPYSEILKNRIKTAIKTARTSSKWNWRFEVWGSKTSSLFSRPRPKQLSYHYSA